MTEEETGLILSLFHAPGISAALLRRVLQEARFSCIDETMIMRLCADQAEQQLAGICLSQADRAIRQSEIAAIDTCRQWTQQPDQAVVFVGDPAYPPLLREITDYPPLLFVKGDIQSLQRPMLAIVGSRNSTAYGRSVAYRIAADLADMGLVVCSGLASGIDTQAHLAALDAGAGTVAVLGNGLGSIYPPANRVLARRIIDPHTRLTGALISELPLAAGPLAQHFPRRNRIISGMSLGVCVVEANMRSGSLITARLALEQNREVFAVPGSVNSSVSRGCHRLLREGAVLVESAEDIVEHIRFMCQAQMSVVYAGHELLTPERSGRHEDALSKVVPDDMPEGCNIVYAELSQDATTTDVLIARSGLELAALSEKLLLLELSGLAVREGNRWRRSAN